jgi:ketosteroid isomerase-like protein
MQAKMSSSEEQNLAVVRALWAAFRSGGVEQVLHLVEDDVEWQPLAAGGSVLQGADQLREHFARMASAGEMLDAVPHSFKAKGDLVLVSGTMRVRGPQGLEEQTAHWLYRLRAGRLVRAEGCLTLAECERILAAEGTQGP